MLLWELVAPAGQTLGARVGDSIDRRRYADPVTVDLGLLPPELARSVRAARRRRGEVVVKPFVSKGLDPVIGEWAKSIVASGELDAAIAEVAASDPDLLS